MHRKERAALGLCPCSTQLMEHLLGFAGHLQHRRINLLFHRGTWQGSAQDVCKRSGPEHGQWKSHLPSRAIFSAVDISSNPFTTCTSNAPAHPSHGFAEAHTGAQGPAYSEGAAHDMPPSKAYQSAGHGAEYVLVQAPRSEVHAHSSNIQIKQALKQKKFAKHLGMET